MAKIGKMVMYTPTEKEQNQIKKSIVSSVREKYAAVVTYQYQISPLQKVNLQVFLDGKETMFIEKVSLGYGPGTYVEIEK